MTTPARRLGIQARLTLVLVALAAFLLALTSAVYFQEARQVVRQQTRDKLVAIAALAAAELDGGMQAALTSEDSPAYRSQQAIMVRLRQAEPTIHFLYSMELRQDRKWYFLVDSTPAGDKDHSALGEVYDSYTGGDARMRAGLIGPSAETQLESDVYGTFLSGYAPLRDRHGQVRGVVGVDIDAARILAEEARLIRIALGIFLAGCVVAVLLSLWLARVLTRPISELAEGTRRVSGGDLATRVPDARTDELGDLARSFNTMVEAIIAQREELKETERMSQELATARLIQQAMLPTHAPEGTGLNIDFYLETSTEVGGDYFDFLPLGDNKLAIVIGDVTGHGVPAALLMAVVKSCLHTQVRTNYGVTEVLGIANHILNQSSFDRRFMTFFYAILDTESGELSYANAGHLYPFVYRALTREVQTLEMASYPLGVRAKLVAPEQFARLAPGDVLVFYSDGIIEAQSPTGEEYGFERLEDFIRDHGHLPAEQLKEQLLRHWRRFVFGETVPLDLSRSHTEDDVTVVVVRFAPLAAIDTSALPA